MRQLIAVTPDSADRKPVETGSYTRWYNQADGSVHRGTDPRNRFQSRGNHGQPHQSHMVLDESRSFFRVHTGYFSNIPKCIKAEFIASWACSQSSVVSSSQR
ncbi:hypothetical protein TNCV_1548781 [Trichonephila clavipes]|nr:hypothetical protein TNCV_1548781 [Trichonephila clavipes]